MENIDNLGISSEKNPKKEAAMNWIIRNEVDIACWQEIGIAWHKIRYKDRLLRRLKCQPWQNPRIISSNNQHKSMSTSQPGGTATMSFRTISKTTNSTRKDPSGLGRWSWIKLTGKRGVSKIITTAYNPCQSKISQPKTVYAQQKRYWLSKKSTHAHAKC